MRPYIFQWNEFGLHTYTFFFGLSALIGILLTTPRLKKLGISAEDSVSHSFLSLVFALLGARLLFVFVEWDSFQQGKHSHFRIWEGGIVFLGGFITAATYWVFYFFKKKTPIISGINALVPGLCMAHATGRLGCFFNGCCFGSSCPISFLSVEYIDPLSAAPLWTPLYPVQLMEALGLYAMGVILIFYFDKKNKNFTSWGMEVFDFFSNS
jgi:phosphatidylglycerol:prolipoprotein diacylglycerol transferase